MSDGNRCYLKKNFYSFYSNVLRAVMETTFRPLTLAHLAR